jgi:hypothetical protein
MKRTVEYRVLVKKPEGRNHFKDSRVDGRIILKWILEKFNRRHRLNGSDSGQGQVVGSCDYGDKPLGSIICWEFLE